MFRRVMIGFVFAGILVFSAAAADVMIRIGPPHVRIERRTPPPSRNHVWISGYHRWDGRAYEWEPGRWEPRPRPHAHWVAHRYVRRNGGWVFVEGHWR
jgi:hypothetical protein